LTSPYSDYTSSSKKGARKQDVDQHQIIEVEHLSSSEPNPRENICDGDKVHVDLYHVGWAQLLRANPKSMVVSSVGCGITCATPWEVTIKNCRKYTFSIIKT
jgi:hypothetical protein